MTYEKDIPDFALVPAKEPEERVLIPVTQGAIYSPMQVTNITEKPKTIITIEEDVLVPDTRPDLKEILMIDGRVRLVNREIEPAVRMEDYVSVAGDIELQTLYIPEKSRMCGPVIATQNRVNFKDQWHVALAPGAAMILDAHIEKIDYMVVNERKYRVKITLCIMAREWQDTKIEVFEGISGEDIQTLRETVELTNIALRKKDIISIKEDLIRKDGEPAAESILKQEVSVVESYKQATAEKVVINGFVYVNLLYTTVPGTASQGTASTSGSVSDVSNTAGLQDSMATATMASGAQAAGSFTASPSAAGSSAATGQSSGTQDQVHAEAGLCTACDNISQLQERVEFTQFIPLSQSGQWSGSNVTFDGSDLKVKLVTNEEGEDVFRLEGDILTWIELYRNVEKEIIVDGYHREKDFVCDFEEAACRTLVGTSAGETTVREIVSLESPQREAEQVLYISGEIASGESRAEAGKVITEGMLRSKMLCRGAADEGGDCIFTVRQEIPFRCVTAAPQLVGGETISQRIYIKDLWAEKISGKQVELNATVLVSAEMMRQSPFKVLKNPAFEEVAGSDSTVKPMVIYIARDGDNLWSIAKKFKSTVDSISQVNQMEDSRLVSGQKMLILR